MRAAVISLLLVSLLLTACSMQRKPGDPLQVDTIARNQHFALVRLKQGQTFEDVAQAMLGDPRAVWQLHEANAERRASAGRIVAVPLRPSNPNSVYAGGYRTVPILCYHQFTPEPHARHRLELPAASFETQLRYLRDNDYQFLSFSELNEILRNGQPIPPRAVVLTIDDGYRSVFDVAWPLLQKYQAKATLFIYTDFIGGGKALNWQQLKTLQKSALIEVASHGKSHTSLSRLPQDSSDTAYRKRLESELTGSSKVFKRHLGAAPAYLSYPYGSSSDEAVRALRDAGIDLAATVTRGDNPAYANPLLLHRTMIYSDDRIDDFAKSVVGFKREVLR